MPVFCFSELIQNDLGTVWAEQHARTLDFCPDQGSQEGNKSTKVKEYSRVWNKRTPLNKPSPLKNLAKRIIVAPFLPYTMKSGIKP